MEQELVIKARLSADYPWSIDVSLAQVVAQVADGVFDGVIYDWDGQPVGNWTVARS